VFPFFFFESPLLSSPIIYVSPATRFLSTRCTFSLNVCECCEGPLTSSLFGAIIPLEAPSAPLIFLLFVSLYLSGPTRSFISPFSFCPLPLSPRAFLSLVAFLAPPGHHLAEPLVLPHFFARRPSPELMSSPPFFAASYFLIRMPPFTVVDKCLLFRFFRPFSCMSLSKLPRLLPCPFRPFFPCDFNLLFRKWLFFLGAVRRFFLLVSRKSFSLFLASRPVYLSRPSPAFPFSSFLYCPKSLSTVFLLVFPPRLFSYF